MTFQQSSPFRADRAQVDAFQEVPLKAGGKDNGPPGIREIHHPNHCGAFVTGPDATISRRCAISLKADHPLQTTAENMKRRER